MINDIMSIHVSFIIFMLNPTNRAHYCCTLSEAHHFLYTAVCNYMVTTFFCCSTIFSAILLSECLSSDLFRNLLEEKKKEKALIFLSSSTGTTQVEGLESNLASSSPATVQFLHSHFEQGTVGNILLSARMPALISAPSPSHRPLLCSHFKLPG